MADQSDKAKRPGAKRNERMSEIMWGYICGAIALASFLIGWGTSYFPLGFGLMGCVIAGKLYRDGERRHNLVGATACVAGILIWFAYNWSSLPFGR